MTVWSNQRDRALVKAVGRSNERALLTLYERHARLLATRLSRRGATPEEIEEIIQETFLVVWRRASSYRRDGVVGAWLWGIAQRQYAQLIRREVGYRRPAPIHRASEDPESTWIDHISAEQLLADLDPPLRSTVEAVAIKGMSVADAAEHLGVPEGTIKSRMHRVRRLINEESL